MSATCLAHLILLDLMTKEVHISPYMKITNYELPAMQFYILPGMSTLL
jgi:hypothetical protein